MGVIMTANNIHLNIHSRHEVLDPEWVQHVRERVLELDRFGNKIIAIDVEVTYNKNPRRLSKAWHVEIRTRVDGHTILAEYEAADPERTFEKARAIMESNLRRAARRHHWSRHGKKATLSVRGLQGDTSFN
jgi:ribosomal subunit interface protein